MEYALGMKWKTGVASYELWEFKVKTIESRQYVKEVILAAQKEFNFESPVELMDYVCETYEMEWKDLNYDIEIEPYDWQGGN